MKNIIVSSIIGASILIFFAATLFTGEFETQNTDDVLINSIYSEKEIFLKHVIAEIQMKKHSN